MGPGNPSQVTVEAWDAIVEPGARVFVRTAQHPTLAGLPSHVTLTTFDHVYEATTKLEDVYPAIADELLDVAKLAATTAAATADDDDEDDADMRTRKAPARPWTTRTTYSHPSRSRTTPTR